MEGEPGSLWPEPELHRAWENEQQSSGAPTRVVGTWFKYANKGIYSSEVRKL